MHENVGASFGLSVLIVVFFAVALFQPETPPPPVASLSPDPRIEPLETRPLETAPKPAVVEGRGGPAFGTGRSPDARPASGGSPREAEPGEPRGPFTTVREGESLTDVARRVYGTADDLQTLWLANRDLLEGPDTPVTPGSILRTP